ncbi:MAG: AAA family ATPase, partial [Proteobacteria bacterium]|nr:AAA family ATPase [Pseudomonadota bacterium]
WLGDARGDRRVRVDQPVQLVGTDRRFTVDEGRLFASGLARFTVKGKGRLPPSGVLEAREDIGRKVDQARKKAAAARLGQGRAACPELPHLLANPGLARAPVSTPLLAPVVEMLDPDQSQAVRSILGCRDLYLLQGPPGTGKTRVILEALRQIDAMGRKRGEPFRVLVSSVQNEAVKNVAERLDKAGGSLIRVVQRSPRDDDERAARAQEGRRRRAGVIEAVRERLSGHRIAEQLEPIQRLRREVESLSALLMMGSDRKVRTGLARIAEFELMDFELRQEARHLHAHEPEGGATSAAVRIPDTPEDVSGWWRSSADSVPASERATLATLVAQVEKACSLPEPRRTRRLQRCWPEFIQAGARLPAESSPSEVGTPWKPLVEAWLASARRHVHALDASLRGSPEGVAWTFLQVLESDNRAWDRLVERHSNSVAATCSMSGRDQDEAEYDWVLIDEAGRANPFELLIPMVQGQRIV